METISSRQEEVLNAIPKLKERNERAKQNLGRDDPDRLADIEMANQWATAYRFARHILEDYMKNLPEKPSLEASVKTA